ncbi:SCO family protein [Magnetospirillum sp. UT-4]|uniref:SCO family protein n=1 Tax=Magnetospirillum sp. UT-4 TaxID=2681467 RepID=UPI0013848586|nr:SCO family protein [Magnetospirillum sp. UT-4]CAA7617243.1 SCO1/SenC family protein [Magnetospirillum sp. UT-4]
MKNARTTIIAVVAVVVVVAVALGARLAVWSGSDHGGGGAIGGPFTLVNQDGRTVTDQDFRGRWMLVYFGYTFCPDVCPTALGVVSGALDKLAADERAKLVPVFVTVDPARDTPAVMKDYVAAFAPGMVGLSGSPEQVAAAMKAYKVYAAKAAGSDDPASYTVDHSSILYLMQPDGRFAQHFPHGTTADELAAGLKKRLN